MSDFSEEDLLQEQAKSFYEQKQKDAEDYLWMGRMYKKQLDEIGKLLGIEGEFGTDYGTIKLMRVLRNILERQSK